MKMFKRFFEKIMQAGMKKYCRCGHAVSANLPFCPHCGARLTDELDQIMD